MTSPTCPDEIVPGTRGLHLEHLAWCILAVNLLLLDLSPRTFPKKSQEMANVKALTDGEAPSQ